MFNYLKISLLMLSVGLLVACGESDTPQENTAVDVVDITEEISTEIAYLPSQVIYQEEIYENWPYMEVPAEATASIESAAEAVVEETVEQW